MTDIDIKKKEIVNNSEDLCYEDRLYVLRILLQHTPKIRIIEHRDGTRINLDLLSQEIINKIHYIISSKLTVPEKNLI
jgi:hypothetical protein